MRWFRSQVRSSGGWFYTKGVISLVLLAALFSSGVLLQAQGSKYTETFRWAHDFTFAQIDPHTCNSSEQQILLACYDRLVQYAYVDGELKIAPVIAKSWEVADDGMALIFHIRKGIYFDDGTPCDAYAVAFSLTRSKEIKLGQAKAYEWMKDVEVLDDYTVKVNMNYKFAPALAYLTHVTASIVNPTAVKEHATEEDPWAHEWFQQHTDGTGCFTLTQLQPGGDTVLTRKEHNWRDDLSEEDFKENPYLDIRNANIKTAIHSTIKEASTAIMLLERGGLDHIKSVVATMLQKAAARTPTFQIMTGSKLRHRFVFMNTQNPPLDDVNLRKALAYAVDYEGICEAVLGGAETPHGVPWLSAVWPQVTEGRYYYDPEKAKEYLAKSNYKGETLIFRGFPSPDMEAAATALVANWAAIGVDVEWKGLPWSILYPEWIKTGKADLVMFTGWPDYIDPDAQAIRYWSGYWPPNGWNVARYKNDRVDELFELGRRTYDREARVPIYEELQRIVIEECPIIWVSELTNADNAIGSWIHSNVPLHIPGEPDYLHIELIRKEPSEMP